MSQSPQLVTDGAELGSLLAQSLTKGGRINGLRSQDLVRPSRACCPRLDIPPNSHKSCSGRKESQNAGRDQVREVRRQGQWRLPGKQRLSWSQEFTEVEARERLREDSLRLRCGSLQAWANPTGTHVAPEAQRGAETPCPGALLAQLRPRLPRLQHDHSPRRCSCWSPSASRLLGAARPVGLVHILLLQPSQLWAGRLSLLDPCLSGCCVAEP